MIVQLDNVSKSYPEGSGNQRREILNNLSLSIESGQSVSVVGPSGCGKSTLLNIIGTLDPPDSGKVEVCGCNISDLNDKELSALRADKIGFVFQSHHLLPQISVIENVTLPNLASSSPIEQSECNNTATQLLESVGMADHAHKMPSEISGGEMQRVAVVRSMINSPKLLLADEPTGALDQERGEELITLLLRLCDEQNTALILVTHDGKTSSRMERNLAFEGTRIVEV
ncbi:MAG: ABC transporter ATP-binding protein [Verrucomicrobiota bacterium]|nr:ABC transporter ATP-binding protein [Verrucomicrobiota bacterium]MEC9327084.1 ABC transporter ATP-binding protein [Verrucomicrobiota bacterium]MEE2968468.1 ABC transporter ATP-binding protein [Verrucomicrobiota bacterium]